MVLRIFGKCLLVYKRPMTAKTPPPMAAPMIGTADAAAKPGEVVEEAAAPEAEPD